MDLAISSLELVAVLFNVFAAVLVVYRLRCHRRLLCLMPLLLCLFCCLRRPVAVVVCSVRDCDSVCPPEAAACRPALADPSLWATWVARLPSALSLRRSASSLRLPGDVPRLGAPGCLAGNEDDTRMNLLTVVVIMTMLLMMMKSVHLEWQTMLDI